MRIGQTLDEVKVIEQSPLDRMPTGCLVLTPGGGKSVSTSAARTGVRDFEGLMAALCDVELPVCLSRTGKRVTDLRYPWEILGASYLGLQIEFGEGGRRRRIADTARVHSDAILKDTVILGENINWNDEWRSRSMYQHVPRNDLKGHQLDAANFKLGTLEDWVEGALELNGVDEYCEIPDSELKRAYTWQSSRYSSKGTYPGDKRVTVDMGTNNFLIEAVLKTELGITSGGIA